MLNIKNQLAIIFVWSVVCSQTCLSLSCDRIDQCKCRMSDGSGVINLRSVGKDGDEAPAFFVTGEGTSDFSYNPCYPFTSEQYTNLAVFQVNKENRDFQFNLGTQTSEKFTYSSASGVSIKYEDDPVSPVRNSSVALICNSGATEHFLEFLGELITTEYEFVLIGPCCCPGACDDNGIISGGAGNPNSSFDWNHTGNVIVGLIFHDFVLVFIIAILLILLRYVCNCNFSQNDESSKQEFPI